MAYADDTGLFVNAIKFIEEELKNAISATENTLTNAGTVLDDLATLNVNDRDLITRALLLRRADQARLKQVGRSLLIPALVGIGRTINSPEVTGSSIRNLRRFFRDWRVYQDVTADEKITARAVTYAAEPSATANGVIRRCTVDERGQKIESGRHDSGVTVEVTEKPTHWTANGSIYMAAEGPVDALDYTAASNRSAAISAINEVNTGGLVTNSNLTGNADTSDNAAVTALTGWTLTNVSGTPTPTIEKTAARVFRSNSYSISVTGSSTSWKISQNMPNAVFADPYRPILMGVPFYLEAGWSGDITLGWGSKTQAFTEADLTAGDWVWLFPDRDKDIYPNQFDQDDPEWSVTIATDAATPEEITIGGVYAAAPVRYEDVYYWMFSDQAVPTINTKFTMADSNSNAGIIADMLGFIFDDDGVGAYLMTSGTNTLADPS